MALLYLEKIYISKGQKKEFTVAIFLSKCSKKTEVRSPNQEKTWQKFRQALDCLGQLNILKLEWPHTEQKAF